MSNGSGPEPGKSGLSGIYHAPGVASPEYRSYFERCCKSSSSAVTCRTIVVVIGAPQNLNVYCTLADPLSKLGSKWLSSRERTQPRFNTRKTSLPGRRIQRKRL